MPGAPYGSGGTRDTRVVRLEEGLSGIQTAQSLASATGLLSTTVASVTLNATTLATVSSGGFPGIVQGQYVTGTDIAPGTFVESVSGNNLTLSQAATGSTTTSLSFGPADATILQQATLTTSLTGSNNDIVFTSNDPAYGNSLSVTYRDPSANNATLSVVVNNSYNVVVNLATGSGGAITTIASDIVSAINSNGTQANALLWATNAAGNNGTGVVTAMSQTSLTGAITTNAAPIFDAGIAAGGEVAAQNAVVYTDTETTTPAFAITRSNSKAWGGVVGTQ